MSELNAQIVRSLWSNERFLQEFTERCAALGIYTLPSHETPFDAKVIRSSLVPRCFRRVLFERVCELNHLFNHIIDLISMDIEYIRDQLKGMATICGDLSLFLRCGKVG